MGPGPTTWLGRVTERTRAAPCSPEPPVAHRGAGASVRSRGDQRPFTRVGGSFTPRSPATRGTAAAGVNDGNVERPQRRWRAAAAIPQHTEGSRLWDAEMPPLFDSLENLRPR